MSFSRSADSGPAALAWLHTVTTGHKLLRWTGASSRPDLLDRADGGSAHRWGFAIYRASHDDYEDSFLPTGLPTGTCEEALDTACGLYLADPTAWT